MKRLSDDERKSSARHIYVGSAVDDAGLTPAQFRILFRIKRRGRCTESVANIAKHTKIGINQCRRTIKELVQNNWISRTEKKGCGVILELTIDKALPLTDKSGVTPHQLIGSPITDKLTEPLTDKLDKGITNKELPLSIYNEYPRKVGKKDALKAIKKALKKETYDFLLEQTKQYAKSRQGEDTRFTPYPSKWFNEERYNDDIENLQKSKRVNTNIGTSNEGVKLDLSEHVL